MASRTLDADRSRFSPPRETVGPIRRASPTPIAKVLIEPKYRASSVEPTPRRPPSPVSIVHAPTPGPSDQQSDSEGPIDMETFQQILELDEDDEQDFSKGMAYAYFSQARQTFVEMTDAFSAKDLPKLSSLGHFLKGSSAALGVTKVQAACEKIQHYGQLRDEETGENGIDLTAEVALAKISNLLAKVKVEYAVAERWLKNWYGESGEQEPVP